MSTYSYRGIDIESDRDITSVDRTFLRFADGSTYNLSTGDYHSAGLGYLSINGQLVEPTTASDNPSNEPTGNVKTTIEDAIERHVFSAARLVLRTNACGIDVIAEDRQTGSIEVELRGTATMIEMVKMAVAGDSLEITESAPRGGNLSFRNGDTHVVVSGSSVVMIGGMNTNMLGSMPRDSLTVTVKVPYTMPIEAHAKGVGDLTIMGVDGPVDLRVASTGNITASKVSGDVTAHTSSTGDIRITDGNIQYLNAQTTSTGNVTLRECTINRAEVKAKSMGDIRLVASTVGHLEAVASSMGNVSLKGTATTADLHLSSMGDIRVDRVLNAPTRKSSGMGSIKIGQIG